MTPSELYAHLDSLGIAYTPIVNCPVMNGYSGSMLGVVRMEVGGQFFRRDFMVTGTASLPPENVRDMYAAYVKKAQREIFQQVEAMFVTAAADAYERENPPIQPDPGEWYDTWDP